MRSSLKIQNGRTQNTRGRGRPGCPGPGTGQRVGSLIHPVASPSGSVGVHTLGQRLGPPAAMAGTGGEMYPGIAGTSLKVPQ